MAILSSDGKSVTVQKGDTLSEIAEKYAGGASKYKQLAALNNISNPNRIYVGQVIKLTSSSSSSGSSSSSSTTKKTTTNSNQVTITQFGLQSNSDNLLFVVWTWSKSNTENYEVIWYYDTGDSHWFVGSETTTKNKESTYSIPSNAKKVRVKIKPISKKKTVNNKETSYWTASWSSYKTYTVSSSPPGDLGAPDVEIEKFKLTASLSNLDTNATGVQFQIVKNDKTVFKTGKATIKTNAVSYSCTVEAGAEYKVRCRGYKGNTYGEWSDYSENKGTIPATPGGWKTVKALSETEVQLDWENVKNCTGYEVQYTTKKRYFDSNPSEVQTHTVDGTVVGHAEITGLESGQEYFFRVRATNNLGESGWTEITSIKIGKVPSAPTSWSSTTTVISGETLNLYWAHNSEDGSSQTYAELELTIGGVTETKEIKNSTDEEEKDKTSVYSIDTTSYTEGTEILWRVRTKGIINKYGDWSIKRTVNVYAPPTLELNVNNSAGEALETLESFPFYISAIAGPSSQTPIGFYVSISANDSYETVDNLGNSKIVSAGEEVFGKYYDTKQQELVLEMSADSLNLDNNITYTVKCTVSMNSGLTGEATTEFGVSWTDTFYQPNAEISYDPETYVTHIRPYCEEISEEYHQVTVASGVYTKTTTTYEYVWGELVEGAKTTTGESVYFGMDGDGNEVHYCIANTRTMVEGVTLAVYRREFDGTFTELGTGLININNTFITDPHPALDYARYRVVAVDDATGAVSYYDVPGYPIGETAVIIQWSEEWTNFDTTNEDEMEQPAWSGSLLRLPYNIDVSDSHNSDVELVEYIGRKHPVSYYGTQLGETASWSVSIEKDDEETLYALRRLAIWMGDVYVREPSGSGYWANISVSFSQKHCDLTIPVTLNIARVAGGA